MKKIVNDLLYKDLSYQIHGAVIEVRKDFGAGHKEKLYQQALAKEFERRGIKFEKEKAIKIYSPKDGAFIGLYRPDFIVDGKIVVEIKAEKFVSREEIKRIYDYLRNSEYELAYFVNFASPRLYVRRIVYTNKYKHKATTGAIILLAFISLTLAFIGGIRAHAASPRVYLDAPPEVAAGAEFPATIFLDSDAPLNAYSFELTYAPSVVPTTFDWRGSIIDLRQDQPRLVEAGRIFFEGASLAPWSGKKGKIVTLNFKPLKEGTAEFNFARADVFLADGKGTKILPQTERLEVLVVAAGTLLPERAERVEGPADTAGPDTAPPEIKAISWEKDPVNRAQKILGFIVADSGSGVRAVEARTRMLLFWSPWLPAQSPVAMPEKVWSLALRVTDGAGNTVERTLYDWSAFSRLASMAGLAIATIVLVSLYLIRRRLRSSPPIDANSNAKQH